MFLQIYINNFIGDVVRCLNVKKSRKKNMKNLQF